jgi:hypothetical protein
MNQRHQRRHPPHHHESRPARRNRPELFAGEVGVERVADAVWVVSLLGEHDRSTAEALDQRLQGVHAGGTRIVLDLSDASFIDGTVVNRMAREARRDASSPTTDHLAVVAPAGSQPRRVMDLVQLRTVTVTETRADALGHVGLTDALGRGAGSGRSVSG